MAICSGCVARLVYFVGVICLAEASAATHALPVSASHRSREPAVFGNTDRVPLLPLVRDEPLKHPMLEEQLTRRNHRSHIPSDESRSQMFQSSNSLDSSVSATYPEYFPSQDTKVTTISEDNMSDYEVQQEPTGATPKESDITQDSVNEISTMTSMIHKPEMKIPMLNASHDKLDTIHTHRQESPYRTFPIPRKPTSKISPGNQMLPNAGHIPLHKMPVHHFPPQEPEGMMPSNLSSSQESIIRTPMNHFLPQIPNNRVPSRHYSQERSSKWIPHEHNLPQGLHNAIPPNHFSSQEPMGAMTPIRSISQGHSDMIARSHIPSQEPMGAMPPIYSILHRSSDTIPPSHNSFQSTWNMLPGSRHPTNEVANDDDDCNPLRKLFNWGTFINAAVDELSERMIQNEEYVLLDHYCNYFTRPYLSRWKIEILADVWCPGWTTITGTAFSRKAADSIKQATLDFVEKVVSAGLVSREDAHLWYINNPKYKPY